MGQKKTTVRDLAKATGVSIATVSRYLNQDYSSMSQATRLRIQEAVEQSGYIYVKNRNKGVIAVLLPNVTDPFFAMMVERLTIALDNAGYNLQLCISQESIEQEKRLTRSLIASDVAGILYFSTVTSEENCIELLRNSGKPFVVLDSYLSEYNAPALVFSNGSLGIYEATNHLLNSGHKRIAYLSGLKLGAFEHYRYQGYVNALLDAGLAVDPELTRFIGFSVEDGCRGFCELLDTDEQFTAVICESDQIAAGVYKICRQRGLHIPEDISVIGVNNTLIASLLEPPLTSLDQRMDIQVEYAIQLLQKQICGEANNIRVFKIKPELVHRESVSKR